MSIFEYGVLQGLAVTPNLQLGESRALFDRSSGKQCEAAKEFLARWTQFVKKNWEYYHYTRILTDSPSVGQVEIYAHCKEDRGYVFLVNPNPFRLPAQFSLDETIGLSSPGDINLRELYPEKDCLPAIGRLPHKRHGDIVECMVEGQSCVVLAVEPADPNDSAQLFGLPARLRKTPEGYQATLSYFQGCKKQLVLQLPPDETVETICVDGKEVPFVQERNLFRFSVTFPKGIVDPDIRQWVIRAGSLDSGLERNFHSGIEGDTVTFPALEHFLPDHEPSRYKAILDAIHLPLSATFLGASIENLLNERYPRLLEIRSRQEAKSQTGEITVKQNIPPSVLLPDQRELLLANHEELWLSSQFDVPFVQTYIPPDYYLHNFITLNFLKPEQIEEMRA
jgi:hypothetical protein